MYRIIFLLVIAIIFSNSLYSQENKTDKVNKQTIKGNEKVDSPQAATDKVEFKNSSGNPILTITDEGNNASSLLLPAVNSILDGSKLYNNAGNLYWGTNQLGTSASGGGWIKNGTTVTLATLTDFVGIGTSNPSIKLDIKSSAVNLAARVRIANFDGTHNLFLSGGSSVANPYISFREGDSLYFTKYNEGTSTELMRITDDGKVGIGSTNPQSKLSIGGNGHTYATIYAINPSTTARGIYSIASANGDDHNYGGYFQAAGSYGRGVYGEATKIGPGVTNFGGYFLANGINGTGVHGVAVGNNGVGTSGNSSGDDGKGVYGLASGTNGYGAYGYATGYYGRGVVGKAHNSGDGTNYGGYFVANGESSKGVKGRSSGISGMGGDFEGGGWGVYATANNLGESIENKGGYFEALGGQGIGIEAVGNSAGGIFEAKRNDGFGVYGKASGDFGRGIWGFASKTGVGTNYGGYFEAAGNDGRGVYGSTSGNNGNGVYGNAEGNYGIGVYGNATNTGDYINYGGYFEAAGKQGRGIYGKVIGEDGTGVLGHATGTNGVGVKGYSNSGSGIGVYGHAEGALSTGVVAAGDKYDFYAYGPGENYASGSSIRWKRNIIEIDTPLEKLSKLRGVYYDWDEEHGGKHDVGMIAEEVGKVLPEIVVYEENGIDAEGMDYSKLTPLLVEVAKAQQRRIEELESTINKLMKIVGSGSFTQSD